MHKLLEPLSWSTHQTKLILPSLHVHSCPCNAPSCVCMIYIPVYELRAGAELPSDGGSLLPKHARVLCGTSFCLGLMALDATYPECLLLRTKPPSYCPFA